MSDPGRLSPVMDIEDDLCGESPEGSPTMFARKRQQQQQKQQREEEEEQQRLLSSHDENENEETENYSSTSSSSAHRHRRRGSINNDPIDDEQEGKKKNETSTTSASNSKKSFSSSNKRNTTVKINHEQNSLNMSRPVLSGDGSEELDTDEDFRSQINSSANHGNNNNNNNNNSQTGTPTNGKNQQNYSGILGTPSHARLQHTHHTTVQRSTDVFESLNYDEIENEVLQEERERRGGDLDPASWKVWIILLLSGALTGIVAFGIDKGQRALSELKFKAVEHFMQSTIPHNSTGNFTTTTSTSSSIAPPSFLYTDLSTTSNNNIYRDGAVLTNQNIMNTEPRSVVWSFFSFVLINLAYVAVAAAIVVLGEPVAKGSGIPEVKCYLNGVRIWRVVRLKTMIVKASGIIFAVASGLPVGKEGPMIHSGSAIASGISTGKSSLLKWDTGFFQDFRSDAYKRAFITAGAAAGVGAAFGAPIGGLVFAIEEVCSFWNLEMTVMVFLASAVSPMVLQILMHPDGLQSGKVNGLIDFGLITGSYNYHDIPFLILLGICCGGLGAIFIHINLVVTKWRKLNVDTKIKKFVEVLAISLSVSIVLICLVLFGFNCVDVDVHSENTQAHMKTFGCPEGKLNDMATFFFQDLERSINMLIHEPRAIHLGSLAKQFLPYFFLTTVTYGINVPSGLFLPSLALGATFGHMFAQIFNLILPGNNDYLNCAHFALYGGTGLLAGNLRMTISVVAIVMEATGNATLFYPLAIIVIFSKFFGDLFNVGIFDEHIELAKIPLLLTKNPQPELAMMQAEEIMNKHPVRLAPVTTVNVLVHVLKHYPLHNVYMVVDEDTGRFRGMLLRRTALILIDKEAWKRDLVHDDFARTEKERKYVSVKKYGVLEKPEAEDLEQTIDLLRYADLWPHVFHTSTPVPRVYRTFRELGLRHIVIVDDLNRPVGLVGRRQLCYLEISEDKKNINAAADGDDGGGDGDNKNEKQGGGGGGRRSRSNSNKRTTTSLAQSFLGRSDANNTETNYGATVTTESCRLFAEAEAREKKHKQQQKQESASAAAASSTATKQDSQQQQKTSDQQEEETPQFVTTGALPPEIPFDAYKKLQRSENEGNLLPLRDRDVRRSGLDNAEWHDTSVPEDS